MKVNPVSFNAAKTIKKVANAANATEKISPAIKKSKLLGLVALGATAAGVFAAEKVLKKGEISKPVYGSKITTEDKVQADKIKNNAKELCDRAQSDSFSIITRGNNKKNILDFVRYVDIDGRKTGELTYYDHKGVNMNAVLKFDGGWVHYGKVSSIFKKDDNAKYVYEFDDNQKLVKCSVVSLESDSVSFAKEYLFNTKNGDLISCRNCLAE